MRLKTGPFSAASCPRTGPEAAAQCLIYRKLLGFRVLSPRPPGQRPDTGRPRRMGIAASAKGPLATSDGRQWGFSCQSARSCLPTILLTDNPECTRQLRAWRIRADHSAKAGIRTFGGFCSSRKQTRVVSIKLQPTGSNAPKPNPASRGAYAGHCQWLPDLKYNLKHGGLVQCGTFISPHEEPWR